MIRRMLTLELRLELRLRLEFRLRLRLGLGLGLRLRLRLILRLMIRLSLGLRARPTAAGPRVRWGTSGKVGLMPPPYSGKVGTPPAAGCFCPFTRSPLGPHLGRLGADWTVLEPSWAILVRSRAVLERPGAPAGPSCALRWRSKRIY